VIVQIDGLAVITVRRSYSVNGVTVSWTSTAAATTRARVFTASAWLGVVIVDQVRLLSDLLTARFGGVHAFGYNSAESEPIWMKSGEL